MLRILTLLIALITLVSCGGDGATQVVTPSGVLAPTVIASGAPFESVLLKKRPDRFSVSKSCPPYLNYGLPSLEPVLLCRTAFAIGHSSKARIPLWVIERLSLSSLFGGVERSDNFRADPDLPMGQRAELSDYVGSGYDRGHMAPAGDMTWSNQAMTESFYLSNIAPQDSTLNRGAWVKLEEMIRTWVTERAELYVFTGPLLAANDKLIGLSPVQVPYAFYKVIFDPQRSEAVAYVYPNAAPTRTDTTSYLVPLAQLELTADLGFLSTR